MKKLMTVSLMLTIALALQAQVKVAPKMEKGTVKTYATEAVITIPSQGDVKMTTDSKFTITDATADGYVLEMVCTDVKTECEPGNIAGKLMAAAEEMMKVVGPYAAKRAAKIIKRKATGKASYPTETE